MDFDWMDDFLSSKEPLRHDCMWSGDDERDDIIPPLATSERDDIIPPLATSGSKQQQAEESLACTNLGKLSISIYFIIQIYFSFYLSN